MCACCMCNTRHHHLWHLPPKGLQLVTMHTILITLPIHTLPIQYTPHSVHTVGESTPAVSGRPAVCLPCPLQSPCSDPPPTHHHHRSHRAQAEAATGPTRQKQTSRSRSRHTGSTVQVSVGAWSSCSFVCLLVLWVRPTTQTPPLPLAPGAGRGSERPYKAEANMQKQQQAHGQQGACECLRVGEPVCTLLFWVKPTTQTPPSPLAPGAGRGSDRPCSNSYIAAHNSSHDEPLGCLPRLTDPVAPDTYRV